MSHHEDDNGGNEDDDAGRSKRLLRCTTGVVGHVAIIQISFDVEFIMLPSPCVCDLHGNHNVDTFSQILNVSRNSTAVALSNCVF